MNIYVETNFVLELVFEQEQHTSCEQILNMCEAGRARLIIPAYCLAEPHEKLTRQARSRRTLQQNLETELRQLARTTSYTARIGSIQDITSLLVQSNEEEKQRFTHFRSRLTRIAEIIPLTLDTLREAATYETPYGLTPQDALVYASVITHLRQNKSLISCFLNRNSKDFDNPDIVDELKKNNCAIISRFDHGYGFIQAHLGL
ncbi:MAG: PIN domain-containing protein [Candidatus Viridilinea halotolerans]|uniref:PIN domain-containing protein n=1 Tax=Candidatus Viridilinea halotolerans TaxID=2491704 RepID=A0A426TRI9_9CHLR|nr:MAG: PIN domain-containing protein [Candidatus Viridilinea halotolerans]